MRTVPLRPQNHTTRRNINIVAHRHIPVNLNIKIQRLVHFMSAKWLTSVLKCGTMDVLLKGGSMAKEVRKAIRLSEALYQRVIADAERRGMNFSEMVRHVLTNHYFNGGDKEGK